MRELPFLIIAGFLLLWGIVAVVVTPPDTPTTDSVAAPLKLYEPPPGNLAELPEAAILGMPWPSYCVYPGWTVLSPANPTVCSSSDAFVQVKQWYWNHLPLAPVAEMEPGKHVIVANEEIQVELHAIVGGTEIRIQSRDKQP